MTAGHAADTHNLLPATETAQQLKRSAGVPFHAKGRGLLRKMDTTSKALLAALHPGPECRAPGLLLLGLPLGQRLGFDFKDPGFLG